MNRNWNPHSTEFYYASWIALVAWLAHQHLQWQFFRCHAFIKKNLNSGILLLTKKYIFEINSSFISKRPSDTFEAKEHIKTEFVKVLKGPRKVAALIWSIALAGTKYIKRESMLIKWAQPHKKASAISIHLQIGCLLCLLLCETWLTICDTQSRSGIASIYTKAISPVLCKNMNIRTSTDITVMHTCFCFLYLLKMVFQVHAVRLLMVKVMLRYELICC